jgi:hypothetical protein
MQSKKKIFTQFHILIVRLRFLPNDKSPAEITVIKAFSSKNSPTDYNDHINKITKRLTEMKEKL